MGNKPGTESSGRTTAATAQIEHLSGGKSCEFQWQRPTAEDQTGIDNPTSPVYEWAFPSSAAASHTDRIRIVPTSLGLLNCMLTIVPVHGSNAHGVTCSMSNTEPVTRYRTLTLRWVNPPLPDMYYGFASNPYSTPVFGRASDDRAQPMSGRLWRFEIFSDAVPRPLAYQRESYAAVQAMCHQLRVVCPAVVHLLRENVTPCLHSPQPVALGDRVALSVTNAPYAEYRFTVDVSLFVTLKSSGSIILTDQSPLGGRSNTLATPTIDLKSAPVLPPLALPATTTTDSQSNAKASNPFGFGPLPFEIRFTSDYISWGDFVLRRVTHSSATVIYPDPKLPKGVYPAGWQRGEWQRFYELFLAAESSKDCVNAIRAEWADTRMELTVEAVGLTRESIVVPIATVLPVRELHPIVCDYLAIGNSYFDFFGPPTTLTMGQTVRMRVPRAFVDTFAAVATGNPPKPSPAASTYVYPLSVRFFDPFRLQLQWSNIVSDNPFASTKMAVSSSAHRMVARELENPPQPAPATIPLVPLNYHSEWIVAQQTTTEYLKVIAASAQDLILMPSVGGAESEAPFGLLHAPRQPYHRFGTTFPAVAALVQRVGTALISPRGRGGAEFGTSIVNSFAEFCVRAPFTANHSFRTHTLPTVAMCAEAANGVAFAFGAPFVAHVSGARVAIEHLPPTSGGGVRFVYVLLTSHARPRPDSDVIPTDKKLEVMLRIMGERKPLPPPRYEVQIVTVTVRPPRQSQALPAASGEPSGAASDSDSVTVTRFCIALPCVHPKRFYDPMSDDDSAAVPYFAEEPALGEGKAVPTTSPTAAFAIDATIKSTWNDGSSLTAGATPTLPRLVVGGKGQADVCDPPPAVVQPVLGETVVHDTNASAPVYTLQLHRPVTTARHLIAVPTLAVISLHKFSSDQ